MLLTALPWRAIFVGVGVAAALFVTMLVAAWLLPGALSFLNDNFIVIGLFVLFAGATATVLSLRRPRYATVLQTVIVVAALGLLAYEYAYFHNRQAYGVITSGRVIAKVSIDDCFSGQQPSLDPAFESDWSQALKSTCRPWLAQHYVKSVAVVVVTLGVLVVSQRRKKKARSAH